MLDWRGEQSFCEAIVTCLVSEKAAFQTDPRFRK